MRDLRPGHPTGRLTFCFNPPPTTEIYTLSLHDALPIFARVTAQGKAIGVSNGATVLQARRGDIARSEEHTSELQSRLHLVCRLLLEKKKKRKPTYSIAYETKISSTDHDRISVQSHHLAR